ncbi:hypothetical protein [Weissella viridescens]|nr:hypothetical protein [Weissella viridescens]WJI90680.1 hypothetical protein PWA48_05025 [Weissella viridescens]
MKLPKTYTSKNGHLTVTMERTTKKEKIQALIGWTVVAAIIYAFVLLLK